MICKVFEVEFKENCILSVTFQNGCVKEYDMKALFDEYPQLTALKDEQLFKSGKLFGNSGIIWNDELDIAIEEIDCNGKLIGKTDVPVEMQLGCQIAEERMKMNLSQAELAKQIGIDQSDLSKMERGKANITLKMLQRIAKALNKKVEIKLK